MLDNYNAAKRRYVIQGYNVENERRKYIDTKQDSQ